MEEKTITQNFIKEEATEQKMLFLPSNTKRIVSNNFLIKGLYVTALGYYPNATYHNYQSRTGDTHYTLLYCIKGSGIVEFSNKIINLTQNTFIIVPKHVAFQYYSSIQEPWSIYWIHFDGEHANHLYQRYQESNSIDLPYKEERIELFNQIYGMIESCVNEREIEICQLKVLSYISSFIYLENFYNSINQIDIVSKSITFMKKNLDKRFNIEEFSQQHRLSISHFSRLFRAKTGTSPNQYFNLLKVKKSCQYLCFTDRNIKEISMELGFQDPFYFSRMFKKLMGISPVNYKTQQRKS
jgi:AraC-like DNA-binding protein